MPLTDPQLIIVTPIREPSMARTSARLNHLRIPRLVGPPTWVLGAMFALSIAAAQERYRLDADSYDWEKQTQYDPASPEGQLQQIRKTLAQDQAVKAQKTLDLWLEQYPNHPQRVEAYLLRGDAKVKRKHYYDSLYDYEEVVKYFGAEQYHTALQREYEIAKLFAGGMRRRLWGMRWVTAYGEAETIFIRTQERAPGSLIGQKASLALATYYFNRGEMTAASESYELFLTNYPKSNSREQAILQLIYASLATFQGPRHDPSGLIDAREWISTYQQEFPAPAQRIGVTALLQRIDESLALKQYDSAQWYERVHKPVSAVYLYRRLIADHPEAPAATLALKRLEVLGEPLVAAVPGQTPPTISQDKEPTHHPEVEK